MKIEVTCDYCDKASGTAFVGDDFSPIIYEKLSTVQAIEEALRVNGTVGVYLPQYWRVRWNPEEKKWLMSCRECNDARNNDPRCTDRPRMFPPHRQKPVPTTVPGSGKPQE